jgi:hypothetical protein
MKNAILRVLEGLMSSALALVKFVESSGDHFQLLTLGHKQVTVSIWTNAAL